LIETEKFYERHGGKTIILARFLPVVRTFAPIIAGVARMEYRRFLAFNVVGGVLWGAGVPIAGYALGNVIPDVDRYIIPIVLAIIIVSVLPSVYHVVKMHRKELWDWMRRQHPRQ
jgi:membrane-associated protein